MCIKDRVSDYCKRKNIAISRFEKEAGLSNGYFNQVKKRPSIDKIESIKRAYPDINEDWLLTGEGDMLVSPSKADNCKAEIAKGEGISAAIVRMMNERQIAPYGMLADKDREIAELNRQIGRLEAQLEEAKRGTVRRECDAAVANAG